MTGCTLLLTYGLGKAIFAAGFALGSAVAVGAHALHRRSKR